MERDNDIELVSMNYRTHTLLHEDDKIDDSTVPLILKNENKEVHTEKKSGGFFGFISSLLSSSSSSEEKTVSIADTNTCSVCGETTFCVIQGKGYCKNYADILIGRKNKNIPVTCRYTDRCFYPFCNSQGTRFLFESPYVTEGYYCSKHRRHIDMMIMQEMTVRFVLKRSEKITKLSDIRPMN